MADHLNAASADEITFGAHMTSLTFQISRAIGRLLQAGGASPDSLASVSSVPA